MIRFANDDLVKKNSYSFEKQLLNLKKNIKQVKNLGLKLNAFLRANLHQEFNPK